MENIKYSGYGKILLKFNAQQNQFNIVKQSSWLKSPEDPINLGIQDATKKFFSYPTKQSVRVVNQLVNWQDN